MISRLYFAYGSNMDQSRVRERGLKTAGDCVGAELRNFELKFNKRSRKSPNSGHANIVPKFGSKVEGVLYSLASSREIQKMDTFEYAPIDYRRELVFVRVASRLVLSWTYIANESAIDDSLRPPPWYIEHLLAGRIFLSPAYIAFIESVECRP